MTKAAALRAVALDAYGEASEGVGFAPFRMIGYVARRLVEERYGIPADSISITHNGDWGNALRTLDPATRSRMRIVSKARGVGHEPHTYRRVAFGTLEVESYRYAWTDPDLTIPEGVVIGNDVSTCGPHARYGGVLLVEKDGLLPMLQQAGIGHEFDLMLAASEGQGVVALKEMVEEITLAFPDVPIYVLHDFDIAGVQIAAAMMGRNTKSWSWSTTPNTIDLGIHFGDIAAYGIEDESDSGEDDWAPLLEELGLEPDAIGYLIAAQSQEPSARRNREGKAVTHWTGRRAELNGLAGQTFVRYVRDKLTEAGASKVVPQEDVLGEAYVRAANIAAINAAIERLLSSWKKIDVAVPADLGGEVERYLRDNPKEAWDNAIAAFADEEA